MSDLTYHIITFGCQMNHSDSERMAGILGKMGFSTTENLEEADVMVINACSVRQKAIDRIWGQLHVCDNIRKKRPDKPLYTVLTGCVLPNDRPKFSEKFDLYFPMKELPQLPEKMKTMLANEDAGVTKKYKNKERKKVVLSVDEIMADKQISNSPPHRRTGSPRLSGGQAPLSSTPLTPNSQIPGVEEHYLQAEPKYTEKFTAFVPIMTGCNAFCTYCAVPLTRGREVSRTPQEVIAEVEKLFADGYKEVTLLGQIINKYQVTLTEELHAFLEDTIKKHGSSLEKIPEFQDENYRTHKVFKFYHLLAFLNELPGDWWLRFTSSHPKWFSDELIDTLARCKKIPKHMHLPVQAGSDTVLKRMLRPYTVEEYKAIITQIRTKIPGVSITTDCIVGFCKETEEEYQETRDLFEWVKYDMAFIAEYSTRPGTTADVKLTDDVPDDIKRTRERDLNAVLEKTALENNEKYLNTTVRVLVDKVTEDKDRPGMYTNVGRTGTTKPIRFSSGRNYRGQFVEVTVTEVHPWSLSGELA